MVASESRLKRARLHYAEELKFITRMRSPRLEAAFATVPRERFVGPGPWRIKSTWHMAEYWTSDDANPKNVYHDVLIALDEKAGLNNGQPSLWAFLLDRVAVAPKEHVLHLGCGTGYYTAILAELVGPDGKVGAIDIHRDIAAKARAALALWPQVSVQNADASNIDFSQVDVIVASAGATHPLTRWLDALRLGGRLLFPMTSTQGPGGMLLVTRQTEDNLAARFLSGAAFFEFSGARDPDVSGLLARALNGDRGAGVRSLRRDPHDENETCWLHGQGWCLSRRQPGRP